jgi:predicted nucleic acid-binding protein
MILVLDTSPVCFLVLIGEIDILPHLYPQIVAPWEVLRELRHPKTPETVQVWAKKPPAWLSVRDPDPDLVASLDFLDPGEREAIALALALQPSVIALDDRLAREEALKRGLRITGLLGLLGQAGSLGLTDFPSALERLQKTHFHASPALLRSLLQRYEESI